MAWVQVFPTGSTLISQSVAQIQANWLFIQNNINTDHYFDSVGNEGHHRFSQYVNQGGDPPLSNDGVVYLKPVTSGSIQPFYQNSQNIRQIPTVYSGTAAVGSPGTFSIVNLAGSQAFSGLLVGVDITNVNTRGSALIMWDGVNLSVTNIAIGGSVLGFSVLAATSIGVTSNAIYTFRWNIITMYN